MPHLPSFSLDELEHSYQELKTGTTLSDGSIAKLSRVPGTHPDLIHRLFANKETRLFAAMLKYHHSEVVNHSLIYANAAVSHGHAEALALMTQNGIPLNQFSEERDGPGIPPPIIKASECVDIACLDIIAHNGGLNNIPNAPIVMGRAVMEVATATREKDKTVVFNYLQALLTHLNQQCPDVKDNLGTGLNLYHWKKSAVDAVLQADAHQVLGILIQLGLDLQIVYGPSLGADIAAASGSLECLKLIAIQDGDLSHKLSCCGFCCETPDRAGFFFFPFCWPFVILSSPYWIMLACNTVGKSPKDRAIKACHVEAAQFIDQWIAQKNQDSEAMTSVESRRAYIQLYWHSSAKVQDMSNHGYQQVGQNDAVKSLSIERN